MERSGHPHLLSGPVHGNKTGKRGTRRSLIRDANPTSEQFIGFLHERARHKPIQRQHALAYGLRHASTASPHHGQKATKTTGVTVFPFACARGTQRLTSRLVLRSKQRRKDEG